MMEVTSGHSNNSVRVYCLVFWIPSQGKSVDQKLIPKLSMALIIWED